MGRWVSCKTPRDRYGSRGHLRQVDDVVILVYEKALLAEMREAVAAELARERFGGAPE